MSGPIYADVRPIVNVTPDPMLAQSLVEPKKPMDWPTAVTLVAFFAMVAAVAWAIAFVVAS